MGHLDFVRAGALPGYNLKVYWMVHVLTCTQLKVLREWSSAWSTDHQASSIGILRDTLRASSSGLPFLPPRRFIRVRRPSSPYVV